MSRQATDGSLAGQSGMAFVVQSFLAKIMMSVVAFALLVALTPAAAPAQVSISITATFGPPAIPVYVQPEAPYANDIWSPGYWAYNDGYYWVPGTWVPAPSYGYYWTPGYWAFTGYEYQWNPGYWATQVGYYGGVNYGYGYYGSGYVGGQWRGRRFAYNTAVTRVTRSIRNVYVNRSVVVNRWNRVSYNGGRGGIVARPTQRDLTIARGHHIVATNVQVQHQRYASQSHANFVQVNHGRPAVAAVQHPYASASHRAAPAAATHVAHFAPEHGAAPERPMTEHAARPEAQHAASAPHYAQPQHTAPQQHYAAPVHHAAPQAHYAAPQQHAAPQSHYAAPQQRAAPQPHYAAPQRMAPQQHMAPQMHAAPAQHAPPAQRAAPAGGGGDRHDDHH